MESETGVSLWRGAIEDQEEVLELGPASHLFEAATAVFSSTLQVMRQDHINYDAESYDRLRGEFMRFFLWNEGFLTSSGNLDRILISSRNLKATVLGLMVLWVKSILKGTIIDAIEFGFTKIKHL